MSLKTMIAASPIAAVISDPRLPDNPIVECNAAFAALTGYAREEIIGRNCRFLSGPGTEPELTETLRASIRARRPALVDILNYRKDGSPFRNAVLVAPIFGVTGKLEYFLGSQMEVGGVEDAAAQRTARARQLIEALSPRQREVLKHMASGQLNKQIAFALSLSERTVKMHRSALLRALGVETTADAIRLAVEAGY
ncbi:MULTISPECIES: LuxR C-terminal-related transcriptional regulator [unclassified Sphingopyxis]|jgi:PAS domain S-box-containing protein|uniref:LuxR C-terminal-related transcriptional regulator n=1 Tax=unclassified Sphingopyxis TaxID=2614943 RepID=UPI00073085AB|nr:MULTISPECIES: LuxR C-terminal-related transcriptional regulator [unclassified Sphingopyxis]MBD3733934.1 PAS domain-containing protein [Sphingopyxis sp.]KTE26638.1 histidine kinase [Sphingopyxis sp. H057]KTE53044.1 histidine kinase [Sphingopyxis sp. H073]KTE55233.1 histidine kinase [Sphingopyxis sp. H071]KTE58723.1 histidine kinase [Sphingopyxis sp. H107]